MPRLTPRLTLLLLVSLAGCKKKAPDPLPAEAAPVEAVKGERPLPAFTGLDVHTGGTVTVVRGDKPAVELDGPDSVLKDIGVNVTGGTLNLQWRPNTLMPANNPLRVRVTCPNLQNVRASMGTKVTAAGLAGDRLVLAASMSARVEVVGAKGKRVEVLTENGTDGVVRVTDLTADAVAVRGRHKQMVVDLTGGFRGEVACDDKENRVTVSGEGGSLVAAVQSDSAVRAAGTFADVALSLTASGKADVSGTLGTVRGEVGGEAATLAGTIGAIQLTVTGKVAATGTARSASWTVTASGAVDALGLKTEQVTVLAQNSADVKVWATGVLSATAENSGEVRYKGSPAVTKEERNSGTVQPAGG